MMTKASLLSAAILMLGGCDATASSNADLRNALADSQQRVAQLEGRVSQLQTQHDQLAKDLNDVRGLALSTSNASENLRKTVNHNADAINNAKLADMTARGQCGSDWVTYPGGAQGWRYRQCTLKDLR
jgi:ABC-type transporter Mla subunit MlaD